MADARLARYTHKSEVPVYQDKATGLPRTVGPFWIHKIDDGFEVADDNDRRLARADDYFTAFRIMLEHYEKWWCANCDPRVYFIGERAEKGLPVKIGHALNVRARLSSLQTASPTSIQVLATVPGGRELEQSYHRKFRAQKRRGEWFLIDGRILDEITRLTEGSPS